MINIGICDDEAYMRERLSSKVSDYFDAQNIDVDIFCFSSGKELLRADKKPDVLFLDIQMEQPDGLEAAKELRERGFNGFLIFVTVMEEYVFNAFEVNAFDYLVKPLKDAGFTRAMDRLLACLRTGGCLLIQRGNEHSIVRFDEIVYCEVINRKVHLHLRDGSVIDYYDRIESLEQKLDNRFFKCHRSYLVNLQYLKSHKAGLACLSNGETVPVSRLRGDEFSAAILQYMKGRRYGG